MNNRKERAVMRNDFLKAYEDSLWYKANPGDKIWWNSGGNIGEFIFSFDKKKKFNLFRDYPWKLTPEQKALFDKENPKWKKFFANREHLSPQDIK